MLELNHQFRALDVHAAQTGAVPWTTRGRSIDGEELEREMHQAGVVRAVVFPAAPAPGAAVEPGYLRANNAVARTAVERPFIAFARINGPRGVGETAASRLRNLTAVRDERHTSPEDVEQYAYDDRFSGFKLDPGRDGLPDGDTLDALADVDLPVLVHAGRRFSPTAAAETLLDRGLTVVLEHFGGYPLDRELMAEAVSLLDDYERCHLDTSAVRFRSVLEQTLREHPDRVLFGSGSPTVHPSVAVMELLTLDVPEDAMRKAFTKNPARVIPALD
ncbi:MAG: amidohydrolase family protein [Halobacteriaceae archaeon]